MATSFKLSSHGVTGLTIVEIYDDHDRLLGCIYPVAGTESAIHIVSDHIAGEIMETMSDESLPVPGYLVRFQYEGDVG